MMNTNSNKGFTLIELSIVLVIIGLIVGGVLVGQDLIRAAYLRAQISQIEKFNTATNTFYGKYAALPGDMSNVVATTFGFSAAIHNAPAGTPGQGDGNGILDGDDGPQMSNTVGGFGYLQSANIKMGGENEVFWEDLSSKAAGNLIEGGYSAQTETGASVYTVNQVLPEAKLGGGNFVYVTEISGINYYGVESILSFGAGTGNGAVGLTVAQAYNIDKKIDDGIPTTGNVAAMITNAAYASSGVGISWPTGSPSNGGISTYVPANSLFSGIAATAGDTASATTCFDAPSVGAKTNYSMEINRGAGLNCALIFKFQ